MEIELVSRADFLLTVKPEKYVDTCVKQALELLQGTVYRYETTIAYAAVESLGACSFPYG